MKGFSISIENNEMTQSENRKLNHTFSSTVKVFMKKDVRYKYDKTFESTIKLRDY